VATNGSSSGNGSINNPWNLRTALNQPASVQPGSTIYLRGGTYTGTFTSSLAGTAAAPIVVRSYPGEWARIDSYAHSTLAVALPTAAPFSVATIVFTSNPGFTNGGPIWIENEMVQLGGQQADGVTWTNCQRGWAGTPVTTHAIGAAAYNTDNVLTVT
jgi:hypothetical protein